MGKEIVKSRKHREPIQDKARRNIPRHKVIKLSNIKYKRKY